MVCGGLRCLKPQNRSKMVHSIASCGRAFKERPAMGCDASRNPRIVAKWSISSHRVTGPIHKRVLRTPGLTFNTKAFEFDRRCK